MNTTLLQDLDVWEELDDHNSGSTVGGAVEKSGDNPYNDVPFISLVTPGQGTNSPNEVGYAKSGHAIPHAFGAPSITNAG